MNEQLKIITTYFDSIPFGIPKGNFFAPIQAGKAVSKTALNMLGDNSGDNISEKNKTFGEYTAWYYLWKNIKTLYPDLQYIGFAHYRRFIAIRKTGKKTIYKFNKIPDMSKDCDKYISALQDCDILTTNKLIFSENRKTQFLKYHNKDDYFKLLSVIDKLYPDYSSSFNHIFENTNYLTLSIFVCRVETFNKYCEWFFNILFELEKQIDTDSYSDYQKRTIAFLAERLLDVWIYHNNIKTKEYPLYFIFGFKKVFNYLINKIKNVFIRTAKNTKGTK